MKVFSVEKCKEYHKSVGLEPNWVNYVKYKARVHCPKYKQMWVYSIDKKVKFLVSDKWIEERETK